MVIFMTVLSAVYETTNTGSSNAINPYFIPVLTAVFAAGATLATMLIKEGFIQNKRDRIVFLKERIQMCYTPLYLKLLTTKDLSVGFLKMDINEIILKHGHLLNLSTLDEYSEIYHLEKVALETFELCENILKQIKDTREEANNLDKGDDGYTVRYDTIMDHISKLFEKAKRSEEIYREKEERYFAMMKDFRCKIQSEYTSLVKEYFKYHKTKLPDK